MSQTVYRCRGCRTTLFTSFLHHEPQCTSYFIEPPTWLSIEENEAKMNCPKCKAKIGDAVFSGRKCSCGKWMTPGIQVHMGKVDEIKATLL